MGAFTSKSSAERRELSEDESLENDIMPLFSNDPEMMMVAVKPGSPTFSDLSAGSFEVEDYSDKDDCDYYVINRAKREQKLSEENSEEQEGSTTAARDRSLHSPGGSELALHVQSSTEIPARTKNASGVVYKEELLIGGGYITKSKELSTIHVYNPIFNMWTTLPPSPLKWFSMAILNDQLVLVGGKEVGASTLAYTNKLVVWNEEDKTWCFSLPPMKVARTSPIVISNGGYLVVAGGMKGSLDYNMEVYDPSNRCWYEALPLPFPCLMQTSAVVGDNWYLMRESDGAILQANIPLLIQKVIKKGKMKGPLVQPDPQEEIEAAKKETKELWKSLEARPPVLPFRIISFGDYLMAVSHKSNHIELHALSCLSVDSESSWIHLGKLPGICANASTFSTSEQLFLFGGDAANKQYSHKLFKVSLLTKEEALQLKKKRRPHIALGAVTTISS